MNEAELQAWVDGRLPPERQAEAERYLAAHPEQAQRLQAYRQQNAALHALFDPLLAQPVPDALLPPRRAPWQRLAAMLVLALGTAVLGGAAGWTLRGQADAAQPLLAALPRQAALAHAVYLPEVRHPVEVGADQQQHLVAWLSKRLGKPLHPPRLGPLGYELVGGRLLPGEGGPVAQFMYSDASGQRLTLYVSSGQHGQRDTGFRFAQEGSVGVFYWIDGSFGYALSATAGKAELSRIANSVYEQLQP